MHLNGSLSDIGRIKLRFLKSYLGAFIASAVVIVLAACGGGAGSSSVPVITPPNPTPQLGWALTNSLPTARHSHTATRLGDGRVLVVGGEYDTGSIPQFIYPTQATIYDPITKLWTPAGNLSMARTGHTATLLPNEKVLVVGGYYREGDQIGIVPTAELYDPATNTWTLVASPISARASHTSTLLPNGKVLIAGGDDANFSALNGVEIYDFATNGWKSASPLLVARKGHTATMLPSGKVLVVGGMTSDGNIGATAELYDFATNKSTTVATPPIGAYRSSATLLSSGNVLLVAEDFKTNLTTVSTLYNSNTDTWTSAVRLSTSHYLHSATRLSNGKVLIVGGARMGVRPVYSPTDIVELYDPQSDTWAVTNSLPQGPRMAHTTTILSDGAVLVVGGQDGVSAPYTSASAALYTY